MGEIKGEIKSGEMGEKKRENVGKTIVESWKANVESRKYDIAPRS